MESIRDPYPATLQLGPAELSGLVNLHITRIFFPKTYTTLAEVRRFAASINDAIKLGSGRAVLVADPAIHDARVYTEIRLSIESHESNGEFTAKGLKSSGFDTEERFFGNIKSSWPRAMLIRNVASLNAWCSNPILPLYLPLRVDA